ncbi:Protein of unknown function [Pyronema omphalodes CBS 100304]|uniref:Uncharacterized protein n=1 Tax=Pyronema omphalodes (strain CBS 100304) TaxID=1076935 RepID=U4LKH0_PYROM|nr:Protein of unknown function [Pyronema omphalodes CBS 100304]
MVRRRWLISVWWRRLSIIPLVSAWKLQFQFSHDHHNRN